MSLSFLKNYWYPIALSRWVRAGRPFATPLLGEPLVLFREADGRAACLHDACPHFGTPLSLGPVREGRIVCPYHGWEFSGDGRCTRIPSLGDNAPIPSRARCRFAYPTFEHGGVVWVWTGDPQTPAPFKAPEGSDAEGWTYEVLVHEQQTPHHIMIAGTVDYTHIVHMHQGTIGRRRQLPQPMEVELDREHGFRSRLKDPSSPDGYNDMVFTFEPPCHIQVANAPRPGWRILANQYVVPLTETHTRLILFVCRNWLTWNPLVSLGLRRMSRQILLEDMPVQMGQYERHQSGDGGWALPVQADGLCLRYRQWYESQARRDATVPR